MPLSPRGSPPRSGRSCPTCGAPTEEDQLVCLECGSRVALDYRRPPSWRVPVAIIAAVVLLVAAASAIALKQIGDDAEREAARTPIKAPDAAEDNAGTRRRAGGRTASGGLVRRGELYSWPRELEGFTVVLQRTEDRASAEGFARSASEGAPAKIGVLRTDDFASLERGFFVVFAGHYRTRQLADRAAGRLGGRFSGAVAQLVER
jgi:hypothetical protein